ncbi:hypothetical protein LWI29_032407 [Acer saccharum]|uniref:Uncharacterized protein n=1 Tax=Acer saccharum TaxID=4024 RepID=A0AA39TEP4_ACESA|nr:hypothetical protein LWI29_032407 [Acer saccharum]
MTRQVFQDLVNVDKWISDMHIQSFFDILWRRRSSSELSYMQNIGLVNTSFFTSINIKWQTEMKSLDSLREKAKSLKDDRERSNPKETTSPQQKKDRKKRVKKSSDASPKAVNVWEEYPEFQATSNGNCSWKSSRCDPACVSVSVGGDGSRAHRSDWGQTGDIWIDQLQCPPNNLVTPHVSWGAGMKLFSSKSVIDVKIRTYFVLILVANTNATREHHPGT